MSRRTVVRSWLELQRTVEVGMTRMETIDMGGLSSAYHAHNAVGGGATCSLVHIVHPDMIGAQGITCRIKD